NDILFTSSDGTTKLSHEIEKYVSSTGELVAWGKVPSVSSSAATAIYMYYGNAGAATQQNAVAAWDADYLTVRHQQDDPSAPGARKGRLVHGAGAFRCGDTTGDAGDSKQCCHRLFVAADTAAPLNCRVYLNGAHISATTGDATGYAAPSTSGHIGAQG